MVENSIALDAINKEAVDLGVPAGTKDSPGGPWEFVGLLPLFDPPRHDSAETIRRALDLGVATVISATATWKFAGIRSIGWGWTAVIWVYNILTYFLLDPIKFAVRYALSGRAWNNIIDQRSLPNLFTVVNNLVRELHTLKGKVESFAKLRGLDIDSMNQHYTV
ncbi:hypothetical protein H0E87_024064 [Populus deltoides]|uniref:Uncharacterized protein n=1 Tax=Populus deltoides TaxID=3696 RepID=A0A8T2X8A7_POPDE|nr:hypothetical protein H0E87_024064 [Populus deltoides]